MLRPNYLHLCLIFTLNGTIIQVLVFQNLIIKHLVLLCLFCASHPSWYLFMPCIYRSCFWFITILHCLLSWIPQALSLNNTVILTLCLPHKHFITWLWLLFDQWQHFASERGMKGFLQFMWWVMLCTCCHINTVGILWWKFFFSIVQWFSLSYISILLVSYVKGFHTSICTTFISQLLLKKFMNQHNLIKLN